MSRLLEAAPGRVRDCIESQLGTIAGRNSCRNSWTQSLDMRASLRPNLPTLQRRLTISADFRNVLTGLDQAIHGRDNMRGWGEGQRADANLLEVVGFDPTAQRFLYEVNEGFGQTRRGPNAFRNAFSITLSARMAVGGQPMMNNVAFGQRPPMGFGGMGGFGGGMGGFGERGAAGVFAGPGGAGGLGQILGMLRDASGAINTDSLMSSILVNPVQDVLARRDSLQMTEAQVAAVQTIADTLHAQLERRREALKPTVEALTSQLTAGAAGAQPQAMGQLMQQVQLQLQPNMEGARREAAEAMTMVQRELTTEQWNALPQNLRAQQQQQQRGAGGFNAVGMLDRMLANPLPVLLALKDTLRMTPDQVTQIEAISERLQETLNRRREELGRRFDNVQAGQQQAQTFAQIQPEIERTRNEVTSALREAERILTREQWQQVPERVRNPFQNQTMGGQRRGGGGD
jgi:hypothetical protein